jgi:hypothetical protein
MDDMTLASLRNGMTRMGLLALAAVVPLSIAGLALPAPAGGVPVSWKDKEYSTDQLPVGLPPPTFDAITRWTGWAGKMKYRMDLDAQGRVLLLTPVKGGNAREKLRLVGQAESWFDALLPPPSRAGAAPVVAPQGDAKAPEKPSGTPPPAPLPEDPEGPPPTAPPKSSGTGASTGKAPTAPKSWGSGSGTPDSQTAVLIVAHDEEDFGKLLDHLDASVPYLKDWVEEARKQTGLTLEDPLVGAYVENASGQEEWNGDHEVLNRVVQLLTLRRFGQQPNWLVQGLAWEAEMAHDGSVYCFPYRDGFVFATEHTSWPSDLRIAFKDRAAKPLAIEELAGWKRGVWDPEAAPLSWGFVHYLVEAQKAKPGALSSLLEDLRKIRDEKDRVSTGPTTWQRVKGWMMAPADQEKALVGAFGKDVFKKGTARLRGLKDTTPAASENTKKESARR